MPYYDSSMVPHAHFDRRGFLKIASIATAATILGVTPAGQLAYAAR